MKHARTSLRAMAVAMALSTGAVLSPTVVGAASSEIEFTELTPTDERSPAARTTEASLIERPDFTINSCMHVTDSIVRLYSANFLRAPEEGGFFFWLDELLSGRWSLPQMSQFFSTSPEFIDRYGSLSDAEFIQQLYLNVFGRPADQAGLQFWLDRMANENLDRGTVVLFFSESPEYIVLTSTFRPLAGYFNWYPTGTEFFCGFESTLEYAFPTLPVHVDTVLLNFTDQPIAVTVEWFVNGRWEVAEQGVVEPRSYFGNFAVAYLNDSVGGIRVSADTEFHYTLAYSPVPLPTTRVGWDA